LNVSAILSPTPAATFAEFAGLAWPATASIISVNDDHGRFLDDGEFHIILETNRETLESWLAESPPWGQTEWRSGPIPSDLGYHCSFGGQGVSVSRSGDGCSEFLGDPELERVLGSNKTWYAAEERCCDNLPWHIGNLIMIDLAKNRVWVSLWDL